MNTNALKKELLGLERQYWQSIKDKDVEASSRLTDYPVIVTGAQGVASVDQKTYSSMAKASNWSLQDFKIEDDVQVRMLCEHVAVLAYKVSEKLTVDGKPVTLDAADASVWVKRDGRWQCALHTESISGDPFGRDRRALH
jgi:hypothetical protein